MTYFLTAYTADSRFLLNRKSFGKLTDALAYVSVELVNFGPADEQTWQTTYRAGAPARLKLDLSPSWGPTARVTGLSTIFVDRADVTAEVEAAREAAGNVSVPVIRENVRSAG